MNYPFAPLGPAISIITLIFLLAIVLAGLCLLIYLAGLPGRIALQRQHPQAEAINVCGWLGLLTGLSWVVAMVWAYLRPAESALGGVRVRNLADQISRLEATVMQLEQSTREARS